MSMRRSSAISKMSIELDCEYPFALGLFMAFKELEKEVDLDTLSLDRLLYELGYMSQETSQKLSRKKREELCEIYRETKREKKREDDRERQREYYKRKRAGSLPPTPSILPVEKENTNNIPPVLLRSTAPRKPKADPKKAFVKPTVEEIDDYAHEIDYGLDAQYFFDYYEDRDWKKKNGEKVTNWKLVVRTWKNADERKGGAPHAKPRRDSDGHVEEDMSPEQREAIERILDFEAEEGRLIHSLGL